jgi:hypothetical protein
MREVWHVGRIAKALVFQGFVHTERVASRAQTALEAAGIFDPTRRPQNTREVEAIAWRAAADAISLRTSCAYCGASLTATLADGRDWFAAHRREVHPDIVLPAAQVSRRGFSPFPQHRLGRSAVPRASN